ncbi:Choline-sulfatase [Pseudoruegeria aquimaris]|uniref:Choline-sulfatase n=1 Tax=Pseudoruegeria aquimaris TaxID=393663 RepID=A0A1Y5T7E1_9RHOB|nr:sulfatase-like hydrolase/transferase [Pseudoruegeria aquimaris]SLN57561.1 Choline-sulfatase [Pseudoruegeria aquimaris]
MSNRDSCKNVVLISLDDSVAYWRYKTAFREELITPNLDRICAESTVFDSAYCQAPLCGPSRTSFMTGKTPHQTGVFINRDSNFTKVSPEETWSHRLKQAGFFCSSGGKIHHKYAPLARPVHRILYSDGRKSFPNDMQFVGDVARRKFGGHRGGWGTTDPQDDNTFYDAHSANSAISFFESYDDERPFYREIGFYGPHGPHYTPARFKEMYDVENFRQPESWKDGFDPDPYADAHLQKTEQLEQGDQRWWRQSVRNYFSALSHVDHHLGRVWDALKSSRHADNTLVVILSDHGFHLGNRDRFTKKTLWEQVANVPLVVHQPGVTKGTTISDPVALLDVGPTILDYTGLGGIENGMGMSLRPRIEGAGPAADRAIPTCHGDEFSIRKGNYRLIRYQDGSTQLYDVEADYWQQRNLGVGHPAHAPMLEALVACAEASGFTGLRTAARPAPKVA